MRTEVAVAPADRGELAELVSLERELAARIARAHEEAAQIVAAAAAEAALVERSAEVDLTTRLARLGAAAAEVQGERIAVVEATSRRRSASWDAVSDARLAAIAGALIGELVAELTRKGATP